MSGYHSRDRKLAEDVGDDFPALNNITIRGALPSDRIPAASKFFQLFFCLFFPFFIAKSRTLPEAHFKSLRLFRKWCRYMPFVVNWTGFRRYASPEHAKLNLARHWRANNKIRNPNVID